MTSDSQVITMCGGKTEPDTKIMSLEATPFAAPFEHVQIVEFFWARGAGEGCGLETNGPDTDH